MDTRQVVQVAPGALIVLKPGQIIILEGIVDHIWVETQEVPVYPGSSSMTTQTTSHLRLRSEDGQSKLEVEGQSPTFSYEGGVLENLTDTEVRKDERLQLEVMYRRPHGQPTFKSGYNRAKLLRPDPKRQADYDQLHAEIRDLLSETEALLRAGRYGEFRKRFAKVRQLPMTSAEHKHLAQVVGAAPLAERPVFMDRSTHNAKSLEKAYGVNVETLNRAGFLKFARAVCLGEISNAPGTDRVDQSYLFGYMHETPFEPSDLLELCSATIRRRFERLETCSDEQDSYWDDFYVTERAITYLGGVDHSQVPDELAWVIDYCLERQYFATWYQTDPRGRAACPWRFHSFLPEAVRSLARYARSNDARKHSFDLGRILAWRQVLAGFPGEADNVQELDAALQDLSTRPLA